MKSLRPRTSAYRFLILTGLFLACCLSLTAGPADLLKTLQSLNQLDLQPAQSVADFARQNGIQLDEDVLAEIGDLKLHPHQRYVLRVGDQLVEINEAEARAFRSLENQYTTPEDILSVFNHLLKRSFPREDIVLELRGEIQVGLRDLPYPLMQLQYTDQRWSFEMLPEFQLLFNKHSTPQKVLDAYNRLLPANQQLSRMGFSSAGIKGIDTPLFYIVYNDLASIWELTPASTVSELMMPQLNPGQAWNAYANFLAKSDPSFAGMLVFLERDDTTIRYTDGSITQPIFALSFKPEDTVQWSLEVHQDFQAIAQLQEAIKADQFDLVIQGLQPLCEEHPMAQLFMAEMYLKQGQMDQTRASLEKVLAAYPRSIFARILQARFLLELHAYEEASQACNALIAELEPERHDGLGYVYATLACACLKLEQATMAKSAYAIATDIESNLADVEQYEINYGSLPATFRENLLQLQNL